MVIGGVPGESRSRLGVLVRHVPPRPVWILPAPGGDAIAPGRILSPCPTMVHPIITLPEVEEKVDCLPDAVLGILSRRSEES